MGRKTKVLIIDDEADFCHFLRINLENTGRYKVYVARDGEDGIRSVLRKKPDVVLLDIMMPGTSGLQVLDRIKSDTRSYSTPVIMLTALNNEESRARAVGCFAQEYVVKPVEMGDLMSKIDRVVIYG